MEGLYLKWKKVTFPQWTGELQIICTLNLLYAGSICSTVAFFQNLQQHTMIAMSFCPSYMPSSTFCLALGAVCAYIIAAEKCRTLASVNPFIPQAFTCLSNSAFHCAFMSLEKPQNSRYSKITPECILALWCCWGPVLELR